MSMSDDPRGFRRGQGGSRDYPPRQGHGDRSGPPAGDRYDGYRQPEPAASRPPRKEPEKQAAFSAFRPEAYANNEGNASGRPERADWDGPARNAPAQPPRGAPPAADPYLRTPPPPQDPYYQNAASDPYAPRSSHGYASDWDRDAYQDTGANQFPNYYPPDEGALGPDAQSVHDRFFAPDADSEETPPSPPAGHYRGAFDEHNYGPSAQQGFEPDSSHGFAGQPAPGYSGEQAQRHHGVAAQSSNFDDDNYSGWDKYDQAPPPKAVRPVHPPAIPDDDLDADFFADEDDYDMDEYEHGRGGGRKKLVAAVLVTAVAVGAGLAYVYKSTAVNGESSPSLIAADSSPIKEEPADPGGRDFPNGNKVIYDRLVGDGSSSPQQAANAEEAPSQQEPIPGIVTTGTLEERIENALKAQGNDGSAPPQEASSPDAPRTVRTVTFGPDGQQQAVQPETKRIAVATPQSETVSSGGVVTSQAAPAAALETQQPDRAEQRAPEQNSGTQIAAISPQSQSPQVSESAGGTGAFFVQIAARNDQEAAVAAFATLQQKYSAVIGNYSPSVRKVDLGAKGVWYRLLVGPVESKSEADGLCESLKGAGMKSCFSRKD